MDTHIPYTLYMYMYIYIYICIYVLFMCALRRFAYTYTTSSVITMFGNPRVCHCFFTRDPPSFMHICTTTFGRTLEAPIPKMSGLAKKVGPFSKRTNPL